MAQSGLMHLIKSYTKESVRCGRLYGRTFRVQWFCHPQSGVCSMMSPGRTMELGGILARSSSRLVGRERLFVTGEAPKS